MHYLYIIHSKTIDRYYVGESSNLDRRLDSHLGHHFKKAYTKAATDWGLVLTKECSSRMEALYLEKFIKRMKSKTFIQKIIANPKMLDTITKNK